MGYHFVSTSYYKLSNAEMDVGNAEMFQNTISGKTLLSKAHVSGFMCQKLKYPLQMKRGDLKMHQLAGLFIGLGLSSTSRVTYMIIIN